MTLKLFLKQTGFERFEKNFSIKDTESLNIGHEKKDKREGWIYIFTVSKKNNPLLVIYIGKTIHTLYNRMKDHEGGSLKDKSVKGNANWGYMKSFLSEFKDYNICGYGKKSDSIVILNYEVSLCEAEEIAFKHVFSQNNCDEFLLNDKTSKKLNERKDEWLKDINIKLKTKNIYKTFPLTEVK